MGRQRDVERSQGKGEGQWCRAESCNDGLADVKRCIFSKDQHVCWGATNKKIDPRKQDSKNRLRIWRCQRRWFWSIMGGWESAGGF